MPLRCRWQSDRHFPFRNHRAAEKQTRHRAAPPNQCYLLPDGKEQVIESFGEVRDGRISFANERVDGWSMDAVGDTTRRMTMLNMTMKDGSYVHEVISLSDDGKQRSRATQFLKDGKILRRTLIDEEKVTDDWAAYETERSKAKSAEKTAPTPAVAPK